MSFMPMDPTNPLFALLNPGAGIGGIARRGPSWLPPGAGFGVGQAGSAQPQQPGLRGLLSNPDFALALLANSGGPQKKSFGEVLGQAGLQANQIGQQRQDDEFMRQYRQAQMEALTREKPGTSPYGQYQPGDYTPKSWAEFLKSNDPSVLERYTTPRQEYTPSYKNVTRTLPDGSTELGSFDTRTNTYTWSGTIVPAGVKARVDAAGKAEGEAAGGQTAKVPAKSSMDYVISQFRDQIKATPQGGLFGYKGKLGTVTDKQSKERFDNLREQLSTEMRTVYRIPGEGTLSDQEQKQYGIQLPSTDYEDTTNEQILNDIEARTGLRLNTPIPGSDGAPAGGKKPKETAAERAKRLGL